MKNLIEAKRNQSISKSKSGDDYVPANRAKGKNRHERRLHQVVANSVKEFNSMNMNKLFKDDIIDINIKVNGETDQYIVRISFNGFLTYLHQRLISKQDQKLDLRDVTRSLVSAYNNSEVFFRCSCPDFQYRQSYWCTKNGTIAGDPETRPSDETNPNDTKGGCCKHIAIILTNTSWLIKIASVIYNYINYMKQHQEDLYIRVIYPAIYDKEYEEPTQLTIDDVTGKEFELNSDEDTLDVANKWAVTKNQFKKGNEYRFKPDDNIQGQKSFNFDSEISQ